MGAYLSEPVTDKISTDEKCERLCYGASSMQGWRVTQEDAHNCIPNYDENSSFFAVYDGHGGAEVAKYCSIHLPNFLSSLPQYKERKLMKSLETAFIEFDALLTKPEVISELKQLAGVSDASESDEDETEVLNEEAEMPLDELLARYKTGGLPLKVSPHLEHLHNDKPKSPMLRAKKDERLHNPLKIFSKKNMKEKTEDIIVNGENESKSDNESQSVLSVKEKQTQKEVKDNTDDKMEKNDSLEKQQVNDGSIVSDCGKGDSKANGDSANTNKESSDQIEDDKVDVGLDKESASTSSKRNRKGGPLLDLEDSDTSDDDYGESGSSEEFNEDWNKVDEADDDDDEEEYDDDDDDEDEEEEDDDKRQRGGHELFSVGEKEEPGSDSGCTAVVALIHGKKLYVANAGDSRCVVSRDGKVLDMSCDHKPEDEAERTRIEKAGGQVTVDGRVNGGLNLSRAIGDHSYKQNANLPPEEQMITALPDVRMLTLDTSDDFMVLACDGIWNYMSSQEVVDFVRKRIHSTEKLSTICEELFNNCLSPNTMGDGTGCDNMTCIIVKFHNLESSDSSITVAKRPHSPVETIPEVEKKRKLNVDSS